MIETDINCLKSSTLSVNTFMKERNRPDNNMPPSHNGNVYGNKDEIDLIELILPLWRNKFLIIVITTLTTAAALAYVSIKTPQYRITAQVKPSDSIINIKGLPLNFLGIEEVKGLIEASVTELYGQEESGDKRCPQIKLTNPRNSRQGIVTLFWPNREQGKAILIKVIGNVNYRALNPGEGKISTLQIQQLKMEDSINTTLEKIQLVKVKRKKVSLQIRGEKEQVALVDVEARKLKSEIDNLLLTQRINEKKLISLQEKLTVAKQAITEHENNSQKLEDDTNQIILLRNQLLNSSNDDKIQLLLLSNIVQQNIAYMDTIAQKITAIQNNLISYRLQKEQSVEEQEKLELKIASLKDKIDRQISAKKSIIEQKIEELTLQASLEIDSEIRSMEQQNTLTQKFKERLTLIDIVRPPFASLKPAKPNKIKTVALALVSGLFLGIIIVYLRHFWFSHHKKLSSN